MKDRLYHYRAVVTDVYDGDTCTIDVDLGLNVWMRGEKVRLRGINAPELRKEQLVAGRAARDFLRELILEKEVIVRTRKEARGKYGRWIADIFLETENGWLDVNRHLIEAGHAAEYMAD